MSVQKVGENTAIVNRECEDMKKTQVELLEMKNVIAKIKKTQDSICVIAFKMHFGQKMSVESCSL